MHRFTKLLSLLAVCLGCTCASAADPYPNRTITMVVPLSPGGIADKLMRLVAEGLQREFKQTVVVENRPGGETMIGTRHVAGKPADGYTLGLSGQYATSVSAFSKVDFDPIRDATHITTIASGPLVLIVPGALPVTDFKGFIAHVRANPDKFNFAALGPNVVTLMMEHIRQRYNLVMTKVLYKGASDAFLAVAKNEAQMALVSTVGLDQHIKTGRIRAVWTSGDRRLNSLAGVPTLSELNAKELDVTNLRNWFSIVGPPGMPADVVSKLNAAIVRVISTPEFRTAMAASDYDPMPQSSEQTVALFRDEIRKWTTIAREVGIVPN